VYSIFGKVRNLVVIFFSLIFACTNAQQYNFKNYSVKEGIAQSQVYCMLQDSRGYLWMGTRGGGITKFDGINFTTYSIKDGLSNNYVLCLKEDAQKNLWIGTNNGLCSYNGIKFEKHFPKKEKIVAVNEIEFDKDQNIWMATSEGVYKYDKKNFTNISAQVKDKQHAINTILCATSGKIYYANANAFFTITLEGNNYVLYKNVNYTQINCIRQDKHDRIWLGSYGRGVYVGDGAYFTSINTVPELKNSIVWNINFDKKDNAWISTLSSGIIQYNIDTKLYTKLTEQEGLSNNHVRCMLQERGGNYWFGTSGGGVSNYFGKMFTHFDKSNGLGGNFIYSIFKDRANKLWIGTANKGLTILDKGVFYTHNANHRFADVKVKAIAEDNYGTKYFGTDGDGLYVLYDSIYESIEQLRGQYIKCIVKDLKGNIWVATAGHGIFKLDPSVKSGGKNLIISNITIEDSLFGNRINFLHVDKLNRIWYATENEGIGFIENDKPSKVHLSLSSGMPSNSIRCLAEDRFGRLWVGTFGEGIASINIYNSNFYIEKFNNDLLTSSNIYLLGIDNKENLLIGSEAGIDHVILNKERQVKEVKHYGKGEGFVGIETCQNAICDNGDGTYWFGTINGLTKYNPSNRIKNLSETVTTINDVRLYYISLIKTKYNKFVGNWNSIKSITLPYQQNHLSFDFLGIDFNNPEAVRYKWKLDGFDKEWSPPSQQRSVTYSNIPSGNYSFNVISCNEDGVWNKTPSKIYITIQRPFWKQWWFVLGALLVLFLITRYAFKQREQQIKLKAQQQQQKLQMEKEWIELEHKALRLQMNPHFIFNALNSIQAQIGTDNEQNARYYLAKFSKLMRQILDNSRNNLISLQEEINMLENYLLVEKFCNNNIFEYNIILQEGLETDYIKIPPMLLQPFVENAIKHGMKYRTDKNGLITIAFEENGETLLCIVTDNGIGRKKSDALNKASRDIYHKSTALEVTEERLALMHQDNLQKHIKIIDLYDNDGNACGTKVVVSIPIK
jgi:ligand-binding sensor domain-containing protein/anti-sigma regulatory factor (Ser/Thr protein kinase)